MAVASAHGMGLSDGKRWTQRTLIGATLVLLAGAVVWGSMNLAHNSAPPKRQVARIMVLPDTPPPPPPPEEKKPPPPKEEHVSQQVSVPKPEPTPAPQQLKMEGPAGEGPSAFAAGDVKQDYIGGDIGNGSRYAAYVGRVEERVQLELTRRKVHANSVKVFLWLTPDGSVQRYTVEGADPDTERAVRAALADISRLDEAPLADMPMPIGLRVN